MSIGVASGMPIGPSSSVMNVTDSASLPGNHSDVYHAYILKNNIIVLMFIAEKPGAPLKSIDVTTISQILMPIADRWYTLGLKLGFSKAEMDKMNSASSTLPGAQIAVIVREGVRRYGDLAKFVSSLTTALRSPGIGANEVATALDKSVCIISTD